MSSSANANASTANSAVDWQVVWQNLTDLNTRRFFYWMAAIILPITGVVLTNPLPALVAIGYGVLFVFLLFGEIVLYELFTSKEQKEIDKDRWYDSSQPKSFFTGIWVWIFPRGSLIVLFISSFFLYVPDMVEDKNYVVLRTTGAEDVLYTVGSRPQFFVPFFHHLDSYSQKQVVSAQLPALTKGDVEIQANVTANLTIDNLQKSIRFPQAELRQLATNIFQRRFEEVVAGYTLETLPSHLVIEHLTSSDQAELMELGLTYGGVISVADIHCLPAKYVP